MRRLLPCFLALILLAGCGAKAPTLSYEPAAAVHSKFSGEKAFAHAKTIVDFGPRPVASPALEKCRAYFEKQLKEFGWETERQTFQDSTPQGTKTFVNLRARFPGGTTWKRPVKVLVTSHYDTKWYDSTWFVGANDGASGNALMLELARVAASRPDLAKSLELIFFDGEEAYVNFTPTDGLYGSRYYGKTIRTSDVKPRFGINFDMIGDRQLNIGIPPNSSPKLMQWAFDSAAELGFRSSFSTFGGEILDDHVPLQQAGVEVTNFIDLDFPAWHTSGDTLDKINAASLEISGRTGLLLIEKYLVTSK